MERLKEVIGLAPSEMSPGELSELARSELERINSELETLKPKKKASKKREKAKELSRDEKIEFVVSLGFTAEDAIRLIEAGEI